MKQSVKLGLVGYGTVGQGVVKILENNRKVIEERSGAPVEVAAICDIRPVADRSLYVKRYQDVLSRQDIDIVIELVGGYEPARTIILAALRAGKHVVTANKAVLAKYWNEVFELARKTGRLVYFEASVGGAIPVIQGLNEGLAANRIEKISGILNGTTNYVLTEMTRNKIGFAAALSKAQKAGFAEADPSFDVEGTDTAHKLAVLSSLAWSGRVRLEDIEVKGITGVGEDDVFFAGKFGYVIKLIGSAHMLQRGLDLSVQPCLVPCRHTFANVDKEYNAVLIRSDAAGDVMFYGKGAGQLPAASAVVSDIIVLSQQVANGTAGKTPSISYDPAKKIRILPRGKKEGSYYLRFSAVDRPGVLSRVSGILGACGVSIASVYQEEPRARSRRGVPIIMLTHATGEGNLSRALKRIDTLPIIKAGTIMFKIEE